MDKLIETAVSLVPKETLVFLKDDSGFTEHIVKQLSYELADRIMGILDREDEVIIKQSDLKVSEYMPTNSVEYRRQIEWSSLVRCGECMHNGSFDTDCPINWNGKEYCNFGERRADDD